MSEAAPVVSGIQEKQNRQRKAQTTGVMERPDHNASHALSPTASAPPPNATFPPHAAAAASVNDPSAGRNVGSFPERDPAIANAHRVAGANDTEPPAQPPDKKNPTPMTPAEGHQWASTPQGETCNNSSSSRGSNNNNGGVERGSGLSPPAAVAGSSLIPSTPECCGNEGSASNNSNTRVDSSRSSSSSASSSNTAGSNGSDNGQAARYGIPTGEESMKALRRHVELLMDREGNARTRSRLEACLDALEPQLLDPELLRVVCAKGLPEGCAALRSIYWRLLLHCLPPQPADWQERRCKLREAYESYKAEFIREPEAVRRLRRMQQQQQQQRQDGAGGANEGNTTTAAALHAREPVSSEAPPDRGRFKSDSSIPLAAVKDHPLCRSATSEWRGYWVDAEVFDQINKDVFRTRPELCFFALNPQQTVTRQQQLHLYPPPPTRHSQAQQQQSERIPTLVNYDLLLQQQQQQQLQQQQEQQRQSSASSNPGGKATRAGSEHKSSTSSSASSSSLKGFRLPSAFRSKKRLLSTAASASPSSESVCGSSSSSGGPRTGSVGGDTCRSGTSLQAAGGGGCSTPQQNVGVEAVPGDENKVYTFSPSECLLAGACELPGSSNLSGRSSSRQSSDAADALEAPPAAGPAASLLKRQMDAVTKMAGGRKASMSSSSSSVSMSVSSSSSSPEPRLSARDPLESDSSPLRGQAGSLRSSLASSREADKAESPSQSLPATPAAAAGNVDTDAEAAGAAKAAGKDPGSLLPDDRPEDGAALAAAAARDGGAAAADQRSGGETVQPWRAPAGVQDVCNMITPHRHYDVLSRLLFIYAKVNAGLCYVQGMNEILAPIYYALMTDPTYTDYEQAEAEIFYCFSEVMQQQRDAFCKALDPTDAGVKGRLASLDALLRQKDEEVWMHLNAVGVEPQFYALRWLLLMLTQEFEMPDVLALWDGFIADTGRPLSLLYYVCVAIIIWLRPALLAGDFTACMKLLQHLPSFDPKALLSSAMRLRADDLDGTRSPRWRVPRPVPGGSRTRSREGLEELDPLQQVSDSLFKPISRAIAALSLNEGLGGVPSEAVRPGTGVAEAVGERNWKKGVFLPPSLRGEGSFSKGDNNKEAGEGPDAALGHLKRLAGVGVEHAYRGASVVSQYLNNSGLASGLASNITSFFAGDSTPSSPAAPPDSAEATAAERPRQSAAAKLGDFFATAQTGLSSGAKEAPESGYARPEQTAGVSPVPDTAETAETAPPLIEYPFASVEEGVTDGVQQVPAPEDNSLQEISPRQRSLWETDATEALGERLGEADAVTDSPRDEADKRSFNSPSGEGLRITIL
ncbi:hypothetical protein, conserved [Eimeria brunetti]|uniref:Rab-GAP TBC domain-containing protein n=1 Tax=Eimeria brunetti TaxID=51314 RepID=U6LHD5_9EIME|nr:hypothetical protein, conserved [Eimeria brunetti]